MDLKSKSKYWTRNIYHQFESICQDVDDFMSKDTMKYVENHVQSVGVSVKRLYNEVQDILPLSKDDVKRKAQSLARKQVDMKDHISAVTGIVEKPSVDEKQLYVEQGFVDTATSSNASLLVEVDFDLLFTKPPSADHSQEPKSYPDLSEDGEAICNEPDNCFEDNIIRESIPWTTDSISENQIYPVAYDEDHKTSLPTLSANEAGLLAIEKENTSCYCLSNDAESSSDISSTDWSFKDNKLVFEDPMFNENRSLSVPSLYLFDNVDEDKSLLRDSPLSLVFDTSPRVLGEDEILNNKIPIYEDPDSNENRSSSVSSVPSSDKVREDNNRRLMDSPFSSAFGVAQIRALGEDGIRCGSISTKDDVSTSIQSPEHVCSYLSSADEEETGVRTSSFSTFPEPSNIVKFTSANFTQKAENICNSHTDANGCVYEISTSCSVDMVPGISNDNNASPIDGSIPAVDSSESSQEQHNMDALSSIALSPEIGKTHEFGDINMETVDLSTNAGRDERSVTTFNGNFGYAASHRRRNFRYYKKLIEEALGSRKRLSKEYEHLAIMYGDIDAESSQYFEPTSSRTESFQEWELL